CLSVRTCTVQNIRNGLHLSITQNRRVQSHRSGRLKIGVSGSNRNGLCRKLPTKRDRLGRVVNRVVSLLRRGRRSTPDEVDLVTVVLTLGVVTDLGAVRQTELLTSLLTHSHTRNWSSRTVTLRELVGVGEGLDGCTELFSREEVEVLNVVSILRRSLSTRRRLGNGRQTIPNHTLRVGSRAAGRVENAVVDTSLVTALTSLVPFKHELLLKVKVVNIVVKIVRYEKALERTQRKICNKIGDLTIRILINDSDRISLSINVWCVICMLY